MFWKNEPRYITRLHPKDEAALEEVAEAVKNRFQGIDRRIDELEKQLAQLKREPHKSFATKLRERGTL